MIAAKWVPVEWQPAARAAYYWLFRWALGLRCRWADYVAPRRTDFPLPPAMLRYRISETLSVKRFFEIGESCANLVRERMDDCGIGFAGVERVLDFGCGCGRTSGWFLRNYAGEFHGVDVDAEAIEWCRRHLPGGHFLTSEAAPPLPYPDGNFDAVYCISVFTHLNEAMQDAWLAELLRVLKPGGALLITVFGKNARAGLDEAGERELEARGFVHRQSQKLRGLLPEWYQTSWHTRAYIAERLARWFPEVRYFEIRDGLQDVVTAKKAV